MAGLSLCWRSLSVPVETTATGRGRVHGQCIAACHSAGMSMAVNTHPLRLPFYCYNRSMTDDVLYQLILALLRGHSTTTLATQSIGSHWHCSQQFIGGFGCAGWRRNNGSRPAVVPYGAPSHPPPNVIHPTSCPSTLHPAATPYTRNSRCLPRRVTEFCTGSVSGDVSSQRFPGGSDQRRHQLCEPATAHHAVLVGDAPRRRRRR